MIGLLDFEGGEKKKEEKGNEGEVRQELSFFLWSVNGHVWEFGYVAVCVFFLFTFFFL